MDRGGEQADKSREEMAEKYGHVLEQEAMRETDIERECERK